MMDTLFPIYFSSSMFEDIFGCKFKFFRKYCQKLVGSGVSHHLVAGGILAKAFEITRKAYYNESLPADKSIELGFTHILEAEDTNDQLKSNERLAFAFNQYFKKFPLSSSMKPCELIDGTFAIEYQFELDLGIPHPDIPERNLIFTGKLDFLGEQKDRFGELQRYVHDDKSTQSIKRITGTKIIDIAAEKEQYKTRGQFIAYHYAAHKLGIKTTKTLVHRIPILKDPEPSYELEIDCNAFMIEHWLNSTMNEIGELTERYKHFKKTGCDPRLAFSPVYNEACNSFFRPCEYKEGCISSEGDEKLSIVCRQGVRYPENQSDTELSLIEYKKQLGLLQ
jgi:hypothetical protein